MAAKHLGLFSFILAISAVTSVSSYRNSYGLRKAHFHDASSEEKWTNFNRLPYYFQRNGWSHSKHELDLFNLFKHHESGPLAPDLRILRKQLIVDFMSRNRNNPPSTVTPLITKLKLSSDKTPLKSISNILDKNSINFVNVGGDKEANSDINASIKETNVNTEKISINHTRLSSSMPEKYILFNNEITFSISPKSSKTINSNADLQSLEKRNSLNQELSTDSNSQVTETDGVSNFISSLVPHLTNEKDGISQNPADESSISKIPQSQNHERNFTRNIFLKSSEVNPSSTTHSVRSTNGFFTKNISSHLQRESSVTDNTDSSALFTTYSENGKSNGMVSSAATEAFNEIKTSKTSSSFNANSNVTNNYPRRLISNSEVDLGESVSSISTVENRLSAILPAETTSSGEKVISTIFDKYSKTDFSPSASTTNKENSLIYFKSTTVHEVTHNTVKNTADPVKSGSIQEITNEISVLINPTSLKETVPLDHVINVSAIRTARIVISVLFLTVALMAIAILSIYLFKIRRNSVQYDQVLLLP